MTKGITLNEFEVRESLIPIQVRGDTIEFAAEAFRPAEGSMLEDLLKLLPGVEIDKDGKVRVNGREIRQILVEGEIFFIDDPQVALKNIPADFVQKIQTFEKKSDEATFTGIEDGNEQVVLNIKLKPDIKMGWFGRLRLGGGLDNSNNLRYANSANINSFRGKDQLTVLFNANNAGRNSGDNNWISTEDGDFFRTGGGWEGISTLISPMINFVKNFESKLSIRGSYRYEHEDNDVKHRIFREDFFPNGSQFYDATFSSHNKFHRNHFSTEVKYTPNERNEFIVHPKFRLAIHLKNGVRFLI